ncbi:MAG: arginine--tRNA ligase [Thermotoga sp.]|nr:MAG: arginine--tRNA ligase [Thermotoga sp.]
MLSRTIKEKLISSYTRSFPSFPLPDQFTVEVPPSDGFGDFASNIAFSSAKILHENPIEIASIISDVLREDSFFNDVTVAGKGFVNMKVSDTLLRKMLVKIIKEKEDAFKYNIGKGKRYQVEFVSANPTGPLTVGHGRQAAIGDVISNILEFIGYDVTREYYFNDAGNQMNVLAHSLWVRYNQELGVDIEMPEEGYRGEYLIDIAKEIVGKAGKMYREKWDEDVKAFFRSYAADKMFDWIKADLSKFNIRFDVWFSESSLHEDGKVKDTIEELRKRGFVYEKDGAVWFAASKLGDHEDWVLVKSTGEPTYLLTDIAYHRDKAKRGFDKVLDIWGADHHGHVPRVKAGLEALGIEDGFCEILLHQFVTVVQSGKDVRMSTRRGEFVTLGDLVDTVGADVAKYFFVMLSPDTHLSFDLDLARSRSMDNPVFYIQYAHARICSVLRHAEENGFDTNREGDVRLLIAPEERTLIKDIERLDDVVLDAYDTLGPHKLTRYVEEVAKAFHVYYTKYRFVDKSNLELSYARLSLVKAVQIVIKTVSRLIGISMPENM